MLKLLMRWTFRCVLMAAVLALVTYLCDVGAFYLRGQPTQVVTVVRTLVVPLKGNKNEFDPQGTIQVQCSSTLFPQGGMPACWLLKRNAVQYEKI
ncbi:MAG: hypothetical protein KGN79_12470 [Acidobacteriota bacterium]|nr:hypothetical protein [Acidobacteriota bacterium]